MNGAAGKMAMIRWYILALLSVFLFIWPDDVSGADDQSEIQAALVVDAGAGLDLPDRCRLRLSLPDLSPFDDRAELVAGAWTSALIVAARMREQVVRARASASTDIESHRKRRQTKIALMHSRIVPHQQRMFIALGSDGHELGTRLAKQLDGCIAEILEAID